MIYFLTGKLSFKKGSFVVVEAGGIGFKVFVSVNSFKHLPEIGSLVKMFTYLHVREDGLSLYGFFEEKELELFEALISVSGVGPKMALNILSVAPTEHLAAAIARGETELLSKSYGVGRKTAERIVMELKDKVAVDEKRGAETVQLMEADADVYEALLSLGYSRQQIKTALAKVDPKLKGLDERLRDALRKMKG